MVDALRRVQRMVTTGGSVVDVHPTEVPAYVAVGDRNVGTLDAANASRRHGEAGAALTAALDEGLFHLVTTVDFVFHTYADTIEELRDHIAANWRDSRIDGTTVERARRVLAESDGLRPHAIEQVRLTSLRLNAR
jgi:hypothetical protein